MPQWLHSVTWLRSIPLLHSMLVRRHMLEASGLYMCYNCDCTVVTVQLWQYNCDCAIVSALLWQYICDSTIVTVQLWQYNCDCAIVTAQLWVYNCDSIIVLVLLFSCLITDTLLERQQGKGSRPAFFNFEVSAGPCLFSFCWYSKRKHRRQRQQTSIVQLFCLCWYAGVCVVSEYYYYCYYNYHYYYYYYII